MPIIGTVSEPVLKTSGGSANGWN